jgi:transcriptional regulator with XRE-family HTH domain
MSKKDVDTHVGKRLKLRRTMMGLSQEAVAKAVGITFQQVQKYEKGTNAMNAGRLFEFARFLNVPVAYFFEGLDKFSGATAAGFAESEAEKFAHKNRVSDRESLEMMKGFMKINDQTIRKRIADLVRAIVENKPILD